MVSNGKCANPANQHSYLQTKVDRPSLLAPVVQWAFCICSDVMLHMDVPTHVDRQCPPLPHYPPKFQCGIRPKEGDTQASAQEASNKPILSAALPLRCLPTWENKSI